MKTQDYFEAKEIAKKAGIPGYHKMKKDELLKAVEALEEKKQAPKKAMESIDIDGVVYRVGQMIKYFPKGIQRNEFIVTPIVRIAPKYIMMIIEGNERWSMYNKILPSDSNMVSEPEILDYSGKKVAEVELKYITNVKPSMRPKVSSSYDAKEIFYNSWNIGKIEMQEEMKALFVNRANKVIGIISLSAGSTVGTVSDMKILLSAGIKTFAAGMILCHNHPSGNMKPSEEDIIVTKKVMEGAKLVDIQLMDHIILSPSGEYYSFADEGKL